MFIELIGAVIVCEKIDLFSVFPLFKSYLTVESVFSGVFFQYFSVGGVIWGDTFFKNDLLQGIGLLLLLIFAIGAVLFLIQRHKVKHWRAQNPDACRIEFSRKRVQGKVLEYRILSIDQIPVEQSRNAFITYRTIYLLPGNHCIEYLLEEKDPWWHGRARSCHEKRQFEMPFIFKPNGRYECELTGMYGKPRMVPKCNN